MRVYIAILLFIIGGINLITIVEYPDHPRINYKILWASIFIVVGIYLCIVPAKETKKSKQSPPNPNVNDDFSDTPKTFSDTFTKEQKAVIVASSLLVANCDKDISKGEEFHINNVANELKIAIDDPIFDILSRRGLSYHILILNSLNSRQKVWLIVTFDTLLQYMSPSEQSLTKVQYVLNLFNQIGISETEYLNTIKKVNDLHEKFMNNKNQSL